MEPNFWHDKWKANEIGFHENKPNELLERHFAALKLPSASRVLVPLCGKSQDMIWLLAQGFQVVGVELSGVAVEQFFSENGIQPAVTDMGTHTHYRADKLDIFVGDFFATTVALIGSVDAVYDRAALVALPEPMRRRYTAQVLALAAAKPQLVICFDYDQSVLAGPPFSISSAELTEHYAGAYQISLLESLETPGGLKGKCPAVENAWLLQPK